MALNLEQFAVRPDAMRSLGIKGLIMKHSDFVGRWTMLLLLLIGFVTPLSASHANSQIVVFDTKASSSTFTRAAQIAVAAACTVSAASTAATASSSKFTPCFGLVALRPQQLLPAAALV